MISRIEKIFATGKAKISYLTVGDGVYPSVDYFMALNRGGVNILEVGVPFSDPVADGISIQDAMQRALAKNIDMEQVLQVVQHIRQQSSVGIILFTYYNLIQKNLGDFLCKAKAAGIDGILVVDLPYEESLNLNLLCAQLDLCNIFVASVSTPLTRVKLLSQHGTGFLYYACRKGTTGEKNTLPQDILQRIATICDTSELPVAVGFGISNNEMVTHILNVADGCVIGSYFVNAVAQNVTPNELQALAESIFYVN